MNDTQHWALDTPLFNTRVQPLHSSSECGAVERESDAATHDRSCVVCRGANRAGKLSLFSRPNSKLKMLDACFVRQMFWCSVRS
jgi:hypothetical protein